MVGYATRLTTAQNGTYTDSDHRSQLQTSRPNVRNNDDSKPAEFGCTFGHCLFPSNGLAYFIHHRHSSGIKDRMFGRDIGGPEQVDDHRDLGLCHPTEKADILLS